MLSAHRVIRPFLRVSRLAKTSQSQIRTRSWRSDDPRPESPPNGPRFTKADAVCVGLGLSTAAGLAFLGLSGQGSSSVVEKNKQPEPTTPREGGRKDPDRSLALGFNARQYRREAERLLNTACPDDADQAARLLYQFCSTFSDVMVRGPGDLLVVFTLYQALRSTDCRDLAGGIMRDAYVWFQTIDNLEEFNMSIVSTACRHLEKISENLMTLPCAGQYTELTKGAGSRLTTRENLYLFGCSNEIVKLRQDVAELHRSDLPLSDIKEHQKQVHETFDEIRQLRDHVWYIVSKQIKDDLEWSKDVAKVVEENAELLRTWPATHIIQAVHQAAVSGNAETLRAQMKQARVQLDSYAVRIWNSFHQETTYHEFLDLVPDGNEFVERMKRLPRLVGRHNEEDVQYVQEVLVTMMWYMLKRREHVEQQKPSAGPSADQSSRDMEFVRALQDRS